MADDIDLYFALSRRRFPVSAVGRVPIEDLEDTLEPAPIVPPPLAHPLLAPDLHQGFQLRMHTENTTACAAAIVPIGKFVNPNEGLDRYISAASLRSETAMIICEASRSPAAGAIPYSGITVDTTALPIGSRIEIPADLTSFDRDLAIRIRDNRTSPTWYKLNRRYDINQNTLNTMAPDVLLATDLGEPVAWVYEDGESGIRFYVLPPDPPWRSILDWLKHQALPNLVPGSLVRAHETISEDLQTAEERTARKEVLEFESLVHERRASLLATATSARELGDLLRGRLLYQTGGELAKAVAEVMEASGFELEDLDQTFGSGRSGDFLVSLDNRHWLIEVTSSSGAPAEIEVGKLRGHMDVWPQIRSEVLQGGALIMNHHHKLPPEARPANPYSRIEFVRSLSVSVVGTVPLCRSWFSGDLEAIRQAITAEPEPGA